MIVPGLSNLGHGLLMTTIPLSGEGLKSGVHRVVQSTLGCPYLWVYLGGLYIEKFVEEGIPPYV